jgi:hypothetical protein
VRLAGLFSIGSCYPIKLSAAMHVTVSSMCSVQDKTSVIVLYSKKGEGMFSSHRSAISIVVERENTVKGWIMPDAKPGTIYSTHQSSTCHNDKVICCNTVQ